MWVGKTLDIVVSGMFSTLTAVMSNFINVDYKHHIFLMHYIFLSLILFGTGYGPD